MTTSIAALCADEHWSELVEHRRRNADILDLFSFRETQHSDLLAWLFNSREGHGQGDAIFRDFLLGVYHASTEDEPGDRLFGNGLTRDFVRQWTPARIMTTSFATASFFREYCLPATRDDEKCHLDLLVIDSDNKFLIAVENKAGAKLTKYQLERYVRRMRECLTSRPAFNGFEVAYVALDRNFDEDRPLEDFDRRWALLGYDWLERAAKRAELAQARGNKDASIVLSYSRQQINYEAESTKAINRLSRELAIKHRSAIAALRATHAEKKDPISWTPRDLNPESIDGQALRLLTQHREACELLMDLPPIELLHARLCEVDKTLDDDERLDKRRVWVAYRSRTFIQSSDEYWPLNVTIRHVNADSDDDPKFRVALVWRPNMVLASEKEHFRALIHQHFHDAKQVSVKGTRLRVRSVNSIEEAQRATLEFLDEAERALQRAIPSSRMKAPA